MRILVAEDDSPMASLISKGLAAEQYAVDVAGDGEEAKHLAFEYDYDLIILDLKMPKVEGFDVIQKVRGKKPNLPVIILSGLDRMEDKVRSLDVGAADYLTKPFSFSELSARVRAVMRRGQHQANPILKVADLELDRIDRVVRRGTARIDLTPKEFNLLEYLMQNAGRTVTRMMIMEHVWNLSFDTMTNVIDVYINYLRKKIDDGRKVKLIRTIRGVGYILSAEDSHA